RQTRHQPFFCTILQLYFNLLYDDNILHIAAVRTECVDTKFPSRRCQTTTSKAIWKHHRSVRDSRREAVLTVPSADVVTWFSQLHSCEVACLQPLLEEAMVVRTLCLQVCSVLQTLTNAIAGGHGPGSITGATDTVNIYNYCSGAWSNSTLPHG